MNQVIFPNYIIGEKALQKLGRLAGEYGKNVLVIGGRTALQQVRVKIKDTLKQNNLNLVDFMCYGKECTYQNMKLIKNKYKESKINLVIGVGGGKALDTAKGAAEKMNLPIFTVPTIAATCAATTPISIVYTAEGDFESFFHLTRPPEHIFIDSEIIAKAPTKYLWAGIGDTLAKYYEVDLKTRGQRLDYSSALGKEMSTMCANPILKYGATALEDSAADSSSLALEQVTLNNIISTGLVSMLVDEKYNGACAHALFYGLTLLDQIEKKHLHGEVVAYGILIQLLMDNQMNEFEKVYSFFQQAKLPTCLADIDVKNNKSCLTPVLEEAVKGEDLIDMPYQVTTEMYYEAIQKLERINNK